MKRSWIGFGLLVVLLVISIGVTAFMTQSHAPLEGQLQQAAECVLLGDWENGTRFFREAAAQWRAGAHIRACFSDHTVLEEIDASLAMLEVCCLRREDLAFAAGCRELAKQMAAVGEAHSPVWWNLL